MIRVAEFREFYELYRGEKEYFLALKMVEKYDNIVYHVFVPSIPSPLDRQFGFNEERFLQTINEINRYSPRYKVITYNALPLKVTNEVYLSIPSNPLELFQKISLFDPHVLVDIPFTTLTPRSYFAYFIAKKLNIPLILFYSGDLPTKYLVTRLFFKPLEKVIFKDAALIISYNHVYIFHLSKSHPNINITKKAFVLPKLVNYERFNQDMLNKRILYILERRLETNGKFVIGYVGRFEKRKGLLTLIDIARSIACNERYKDKVRLLLVGDGSLRQHLEALAKREKLPIIVFGPVPSKLIPYIFALIDVVIFPTTPFFSTSLIEAMASGKIILSGANKEDYKSSTPLINYHDSIIVHPNTAEKFLEVLGKIIENKTSYEALGKNARKKVINLFNIEKLCSRYYKLIILAIFCSRRRFSAHKILSEKGRATLSTLSLKNMRKNRNLKRE